MQDQRIYLDYNATMPLAKKVKTYLASGFFIDANSSAQHTSGKLSKKQINNCSKKIHQVFSTTDDQFKIIYHSGATEGVNFMIQGFNKFNFGMSHFIFSKTDHKCVLEQRVWLEKLGAQVAVIDVDADNNPSVELIEAILKATSKKVLLNLTWVNNETGQIQKLDKYSSLKKDYSNLFIHIDAAQVVGKIPDWRKLNPIFDAYTFSGHKFGALKGVGFSLLKTNFEISPLIYGGGHQDNLRSGTENTFGIHTLSLALDEIIESVKFDLVLELKMLILAVVKKYKQHLFIIENNTVANTINIIFNDFTSDKLLPFFDLAGIDVSSGSACNSGSSKNSHVLMALGFSELAKNGIRLSLPLYDFDKSIITGKIEECFIKIFGH